MTSALSRSLLVAGLSTIMAFGAQWTLVRFAYDGNWTALFYSGEKYGTPPPNLADENIYLVVGSNGYDGQIYHYIAHDPLMRHGVAAQVDAPRLRYRRILIPLLAWIGSAGDGTRVDQAYRAAILAFVFLGAYFTARLAEALGRSPIWGAAFVLLPASIVSVERMTVDVALAALVAGWALAVRRASRLQWLALAAAPLVRETGLVLVAAAIIAALSDRRFARAAVAALTAVPACAWFAFVQVRTPPFEYPNSIVPLSGIVRALAHSAPYPAGGADGEGFHAAWRSMAPTTLQVMDGLALVAIILAFVLAGRWHLNGPRSALSWAAALFALLGVFTQRPDNWTHVYDFGRVYSPLLLLLALEGHARREWHWAAPWCLLEPRLLFQFSGPALSAFRGMLGFISALRLQVWSLG